MAIRVIRLVNSLPGGVAADVLGKQLVRSATSIAANYYSACKARSKADFLNKLGIVEEEADETQLWIELLAESQIVRYERMKALLEEVQEITAIVAASRITMRSRLKPKSSTAQSKTAN